MISLNSKQDKNLKASIPAWMFNSVFKISTMFLEPTVFRTFYHWFLTIITSCSILMAWYACLTITSMVGSFKSLVLMRWFSNEFDCYGKITQNQAYETRLFFKTIHSSPKACQQFIQIMYQFSSMILYSYVKWKHRTACTSRYCQCYS